MSEEKHESVWSWRGKKGEHSRKNRMINCAKYIRISADTIKNKFMRSNIECHQQTSPEKIFKVEAETKSQSVEDIMWGYRRKTLKTQERGKILMKFPKRHLKRSKAHQNRD